MAGRKRRWIFATKQETERIMTGRSVRDGWFVFEKKNPVFSAD